jgi:hypothetical protein
MTDMSATRRAELIALVERLLTGDFESEEQEDRAIAEFASSVPHPRAADLIYHWAEEFEVEPSAEDVVDRALNHRSIEL